jgi:signal peptidase I
LSAAVAALVVLSARSSLADHYVVPSGSMLPTVQEGDRIVVDKLAYGLRLPFTNLYIFEDSDPAPGEVVIVESPANGNTLVKRVVGGPGDVVEVQNGRIFLNGEPVEILSAEGGGLVEILGREPHPLRLTRGGGPDYGPRQIPLGRFLVMGDNRGDSFDGRLFGLVRRGAIRGRAVAVYHSSGSFTWRAL